MHEIFEMVEENLNKSSYEILQLVKEKVKNCNGLLNQIDFSALENFIKILKGDVAQYDLIGYIYYDMYRHGREECLTKNQA